VKKQPAPCKDCGVETTPEPLRDGTWEWYMVRDHVWTEAGMESYNGGCLCIGCLELRLGRSLCREDFRPTDLTTDWIRESRLHTPRLRSRYNAKHRHRYRG
jgi:hypothetical protein